MIWLIALNLAVAEGTADIGTTQELSSYTTMYVDIVDLSETITWSGSGSLYVISPSGTNTATLGSGGSYTTTETGAHQVRVSTSQSIGSSWDIGVGNQTTSGGRLWSMEWSFNAGSFAQTASITDSFYALISAGSESDTQVIELQFDGLAGYVWSITANATGVDGRHGGRSVPMSGNYSQPDQPIYFNPPAIATYTSSTPGIQAATADGSAGAFSVDGAPLACDQFASGSYGAVFSFSCDATGQYNIMCDMDDDGNFARQGSDLLLTGSCDAGVTNTVSWDGNDNMGNPVSPGTYDCQVTNNVGEFHFVGEDIETIYPGMRMYQLESDGSRTPLNMFWDDGEVMDYSVAMPNGEEAPIAPADSGMNSGIYGTGTIAGGNARSWGNFTGWTRGNSTFMDTYVFLDDSTPVALSLENVDGTLDSDGDGLTDHEEDCFYGTDPADDDWDDDGILDGEDYAKHDTSSAVEGGLESNGRRAEAIAQRDWSARSSRLDLRITGDQLSDWAPDFSNLGWSSAGATPNGLGDTTNALASQGTDWHDAMGFRIGSTLMLLTDDVGYEHSKPICDRAHGAVLTRSAMLDAGGGVPVHHLNWDDGARDVTTTLRVWLDGDGNALSGEALSLGAGDEGPEDAVQALTIQLWANHIGNLEAMVDETLAGLGLPDVDAPDPSPVYVSKGVTRGSSVTVHVSNPEGLDGELMARYIDYNDEMHEVQVAELAGEAGAFAFTLPDHKELTLEVVSGGERMDRAWLSDGVWFPYTDEDLGGQSAVSFDTACDAIPATQDTPWDGERLGGCAELHGTVDSFAGIARHLGAQPVTLPEDGAVRVHYRSNTDLHWCLEDVEHVRTCSPLAAAPDGAWAHMNVADLPELDALGWILFEAKAGEADFQVQSIGWTDTALASNDAADDDADGDEVQVGCSGCSSSSGSGLVLGVFGLLALRRRR